MSGCTVNIKWGKQKFEKVEVNTNDPPEVFMAQIFALSGVPPERQKIMAKGKTLKEGDSWSGFPVKSGTTWMLMGSADALPAAPVQQTKFIEDQPEGASLMTDLPAGLSNLGNTCYMNATVQCLKNVPELQDGLNSFEGKLNVGSVLTNPSEAITASLRDLYKMMDKATTGFPPFIFLQVLHSAFPHFAEKGEGGVFQQQDANECWTQIVRMLQQKLPSRKSNTEATSAGAVSSGSLIDQCFGINYKSTMKCDESEDEPETESTERVYQLSCHITQDVKYLHTGLRNRLKETITKASPTLNRDASYTKTNLIDRLPSYLTVQFVRFYYKEKEKINAKVLKEVQFPMVLDTYELCSPDLQKKLLPMRNKFKDKEDKDAERKAAAKKAKEDDPNKMDVDTPSENSNSETLPFEFADDPNSNNSGYYELTAVLTHKGRSSSSGHYVAWVRHKGDQWLMYDDDNVHPMTQADVLKLNGGGDWHTAYVLLYGPKKLVVEKDDK